MLIPKFRPAAAIQYESNKLEALFASIGAGIIASDEDGNVMRINQAALHLLGFRGSEVLGKRFTETIIALHDNGTPIDTIDRPIVKAFLTGKTVSARTIYKKKNGNFLPVQITVSPLEFEGRPIGAIEVFRDITLDIEQDKLKSDFISLASHQLRTPLSSIQIYSKMLQDGLAGDLNERQQLFIDTIATSVDRMNELINTLLNVTRIEAGGIAVHTEKVSLDVIVREVLSEAIVSAQEKKIDIATTIADTISPIKTDQLLVREVYTNLISNAVKYTPNGGKITISLSEGRKDVVFSVKDTGYGIPKSAQKSIFTKFFRAENILLYDVSGTGLGLYFTKAIADALDGELWFNSSEKRGSTFYFSLPLDGSIAKAGKFKLSS